MVCDYDRLSNQIVFTSPREHTTNHDGQIAAHIQHVSFHVMYWVHQPSPCDECVYDDCRISRTENTRRSSHRDKASKYSSRLGLSGRRLLLYAYLSRFNTLFQFNSSPLLCVTVCVLYWAVSPHSYSERRATNDGCVCTSRCSVREAAEVALVPPGAAAEAGSGAGGAPELWMAACGARGITAARRDRLAANDQPIAAAEESCSALRTGQGQSCGWEWASQWHCGRRSSVMTPAAKVAPPAARRRHCRCRRRPPPQARPRAQFSQSGPIVCRTIWFHGRTQRGSEIKLYTNFSQPEAI